MVTAVPGDSEMKSTIAENAGSSVGKNVGNTRSKLKGLSIRSNSDLNVPCSNINSAKSPKNKSPMKRQPSIMELSQLNGHFKSLSPHNLLKAVKVCIGSDNTVSP